MTNLRVLPQEATFRDAETDESAEMEEKMEPETIVKHYKIISSIGKGEIGEEFLARDTKLGRKIAIKFLNEFSKDRCKQVLSELCRSAGCNLTGQ